MLLDCLRTMEGKPGTRAPSWVGPGLPSYDRGLQSSRSHGESTTSRDGVGVGVDMQGFPSLVLGIFILLPAGGDKRQVLGITAFFKGWKHMLPKIKAK